jgi:UDP-glucose:glycoprotein glucosyltransferase
MHSLAALGLSRKQAFELLTHPDIASDTNEGVIDSLFDASDRIEGGKAIVWWNDLEHDGRCA